MSGDISVFSRAGLSELLDLDGAHPSEIVWQSRLVSWSFPAVALSVFASEGVQLSDAAAAELSRIRARHDVYRRVVDQLATFASFRVVKGPAIASRFPTGIVRQAGDLDLIFDDQDSVWQAVRSLLDGWPINDFHVSYFGDPRQIAASLLWDGDDPLLDHQYMVELTTAAFVGNGGSVGIRALPTASVIDDRSVSLLALAEEQFQRPVRPSDIVDFLALCKDGVPPGIVEAAARLQLAPELLELLLETSQRFTVSLDGRLRASLANAAEAEVHRRSEARYSGVGEAASGLGFDEHLLRGGSWHAFPLRVDPNARTHTVSITDHEFGPVLRSPLGVFLLVSSAEVPESAFDAAVEYAGETG